MSILDRLFCQLFTIGEFGIFLLTFPYVVSGQIHWAIAILGWLIVIVVVAIIETYLVKELRYLITYFLRHFRQH